MTGQVVHFELPYDDGERARRFYGDVFGWQIQHLPELSYDIVSTGPVNDEGRPGEPGYIGGGMAARGEPLTKPVITIEVDDIEATLEQVQSRGGARVGEKLTVGDMGFAAYFEDSEGNLMGLWESAARER